MLRRIAIMALLAAMADAGAARAGTLNVTVSRSADGSPVDGALVTVVRDGELPISNRSGMTGLVVFTNLAEGVYRVAVADAPDLASEVYDNRPLVSSDPALQPFDGVVVSAVGTKTITLALEPGGAIAGAVHDLRTGITHRDRMIDVERLRPDGGLVETYFLESDAAGNYALPRRIPSGSWRFRVKSYDPSNGPLFGPVLHPSVPCPESGCDPVAGALVAVTAPATTTGIDFGVQGLHAITGRVTDASTGDPLAGITVESAFAPLFWLPTDRAVTGNDGRYALYSPRFTAPMYVSVDNRSGYLNQRYAGLSCAPGICPPDGVGNAVATSAAAAATGIDFPLVGGTQLAGVVRDGLTLAGAPASVRIADAGGSVFWQANTDGAGAFATLGLPAGTWYVIAYGHAGESCGMHANVACDEPPVFNVVDTRRATPIVSGSAMPPVALDLRLYAYQVLFRDGME